MYLIDTSVWIDFLRAKKTPPVKQFVAIINDQIPFGITSLIYQEVLQGAASDADFVRLNEYMSSQRFFYPKDPLLSFQAAARIYFDARQQGITIRSTLDCLIAQLALEHQLILLHNDQDFEHIKQLRAELRLG